jgi:hypothetical protein
MTISRTRVTTFVAVLTAAGWLSPIAQSTSDGGGAPVQWGEFTSASVGAGTIVKIAGCEGCPNAGGVSLHAVSTTAGGVDFVPAAGHRLDAGLTDTSGALPDRSTMPYAFNIWPDGGWDVRERGVYKTEGRFSPGDRFRIALVNGLVRYYWNDQLVYTSAVVATGALRFGATLYSKTASIGGANLSGSAAAVTSYQAITDTVARPEPPLPVFAAAGHSAAEPTFGTTIVRITDALTRPDAPGRSFRTPSGTHQHAWSARGSYFYVVSTDGTIIPYSFDAATGTAARLDATSTGAGGRTLRFFNEPQFSYVSDTLIYATFTGSGATLRTIDQYDFSTGLYTRLLDLDTVVAGLDGTLVGGIGSSGGPVEKIVSFFGGAWQDQHHYVVVLEKSNPTRRRVLDALNSTLDGQPTSETLNFRLHHATIDRTGRYVLLYPTSVDRAAPRAAAPVYLWDTEVDSITPLDSITARSNGHDAPGYATLVNQDCCTTSAWDAAQWQLRSLASPLVTRDVILPVLLPKVVSMADHPSWHNARPDVPTPFITALYRIGPFDLATWRAWDDEIVAVQTNVPSGVGATVWRLAHHRSDIGNDNDPSVLYFWYTPRPNVSPDGRWILFTSNWEKTLGPDPGGEQGGAFRQDVFLVRAR